MKKVIRSIFVAMLCLTLLFGCSREVKQTPLGWSLQYAIEEYNIDYGNYYLVGWESNKYNKLQIDTNFDNYDMFKITLINNNAQTFTYICLIAYTKSRFQEVYGKEDCFIKESNILQFNITRVYT